MRCSDCKNLMSPAVPGRCTNCPSGTAWRICNLCTECSKKLKKCEVCKKNLKGGKK